MTASGHNYFEVVEYRVRVIEAVGCPACSADTGAQCSDGETDIDYVHDMRAYMYDRLRVARNHLLSAVEKETREAFPAAAAIAVDITDTSVVLTNESRCSLYVTFGGVSHLSPGDTFSIPAVLHMTGVVPEGPHPDLLYVASDGVVSRVEEFEGSDRDRALLNALLNYSAR